jgi:hypothetical protein
MSKFSAEVNFYFDHTGLYSKVNYKKGERIISPLIVNAPNGRNVINVTPDGVATATSVDGKKSMTLDFNTLQTPMFYGVAATDEMALVMPSYARLPTDVQVKLPTRSSNTPGVSNERSTIGNQTTPTMQMTEAKVVSSGTNPMVYIFIIMFVLVIVIALLTFVVVRKGSSELIANHI